MIVALQSLVGTATSVAAPREADIGGNGNTGLEEAIYVLQIVSGARLPEPSLPTPIDPFEINVSSPPEPAGSGVVPKLTVFAEGLSSPWGMAFMPDGQILATQRTGSLVLVSGDGSSVSNPIANVPAVNSAGQGGLLDVSLDPQFTENRLVYLSFSEPGTGATTGTAVARGELNVSSTSLENVIVIFRQSPKKPAAYGHYGSRLVFRTDATLFVTLGDRQVYSSEAQSLESQLGKIVHAAPHASPLAYWYPVSTAPGGMAFYTGDKFPEWQGSLFVGGLAGETLWRLELDGNAVVGVERFFVGQHQIRDVRQGPDGWIYLLSRNTNQILRVER